MFPKKSKPWRRKLPNGTVEFYDSKTGTLFLRIQPFNGASAHKFVDWIENLKDSKEILEVQLKIARGEETPIPYDEAIKFLNS